MFVYNIFYILNNDDFNTYCIIFEYIPYYTYKYINTTHLFGV